MAVIDEQRLNFFQISLNDCKTLYLIVREWNHDVEVFCPMATF
jgi:hypothetical protein